MNKISIYTLIFSLIFIAINSAYAQSDIKHLTLSECLSMGIEKNFDIRIVKKEQTITDNNYTLGNAGFLPSLDFTASAPGSAATNSDASSQQVNGSLDLTWNLFNGFNARATYDKLRELQQIGELSTKISIENIIAEISSVYYQIVTQEIRSKNIKKSLELSRERLEIVKARYELGSASRLEYQQAEVDYNADKTLHFKQAEIIYSYRVRLNQLISMENVDAPTRVTDNEINLLQIGSKDDLWKSIEVANSVLLSAEKSMTISESDLRIAKSRKYPYVNLSGGYGYNSTWQGNSDLTKSETMGFNYGLTVGVNIFDGYNRRREQRNASTQVDIAKIRVESLEQTLKADLANLWMSYNINKSIVDMERSNVEAATENLEIAMERYKLEELSGIELREAQNSLLEAEERLATAQYDTKASEISLLLLSGEIIQRLMN